MESTGSGLALLVVFAAIAAAGLLALAVERWGRLKASAKAGAAAVGRAVSGALRRRWARISERLRLRVAAALLDAGNHLMLSDDERRALRVEKKLRAAVSRGPRRARRQALRLGAEAWRGSESEDFEVLCVPVGARPEAGGLRQLSLSCVLYPPFDPYDERGGCHFVWRVANGPAPDPSGRPGRGPTSYCEVPTLHQALVSYFAPPVRPGKDLFWEEEAAYPEPHGAPLPEEPAPASEAQAPAAGPAA